MMLAFSKNFEEISRFLDLMAPQSRLWVIFWQTNNLHFVKCDKESIPHKIMIVATGGAKISFGRSSVLNSLVLAPPDANIKNFCSIGNKIQKLVSGVDLMHFGPIERNLSPKNRIRPPPGQAKYGLSK